MAPGLISLNLARIVHRLLTSHRGWRVCDLMEQLGIAERTYRKYRKILQEEFTPFQHPDGISRVHEIGQGEDRWLRIAHFDEKAVTRSDFPYVVSALAFARQMLGFLQNTPISQAMNDLVEEFNHHIKDRHFIVGHLLRNVDRLFRVVPFPCQDYSRKRETISLLLQALLFTHRLDADYHCIKGETERLVLEPLSLVLHHGTLCLLAHRLEDPAIHCYSVAGLERIALRADRYEYPHLSAYQPDNHTEGCFGLLEDHLGATTPVELVFRSVPWLKTYVRQRRWHPTQRFEDLPDGRLRMSFTARSMVEVWPWIRSFGEDVAVVKPTGPVPRSRTADRDDHGGTTVGQAP